jgi:hypothetical protein
MRKLFKKFLIYLLAIGMLMPTWLVTGLLSATHAKAFSLLKPVLSEIYFDSTGDKLEIYNPNAESLDLIGYKIKWEKVLSLTEEVTIQDDVVVPAGEARVLTNSEFSTPLNFDLTGRNKLTFMSPDNDELQPVARFGTWFGCLKPAIGQSIQ